MVFGRREGLRRRHAIEQAVRKSEAQFRTLADSVSDLIIPVVDRGGTVGAMAAARGIPCRPLVTAPDLGFPYEGA